ncbi:MAG: transglycosylase SLT domain-containing protein [Paludibacteraceae bacterium]|nr:transglycosylase SLT domain-containing protein [Paludibacteraceae bacterium]
MAIFNDTINKKSNAVMFGSILFCFYMVLSFAGCRPAPKPVSQPVRDLVEIIAHDTLRVVTMNGPTAFFYYRDQPMGYDYELVSMFADYLGVKLSVAVAYSPSEMLRKLRSGSADLVAYNLAPLRLSDDVRFWSIHERSPLVLLQSLGAKPVTSIGELKKQKIHVVHNSVYERQLKALNEETGGDLHVVLEPDSLIDQLLVQRVSKGEIPATVVYANQVPVYRKMFKNIKATYQVSVGLSMGWVTREGSGRFNAMLEQWLELIPQKELERLRARYYSRNVVRERAAQRIRAGGAISPYDALFMRYAPAIGWDWRMLASLCYHESRFNPNTTSPMGARGLMQLVPVTAKRFGLTDDNAYEPEASVMAGVQYIKYLQMVYSSVEDREERVKFVLASYNAGPAHILDAIALTKKYGGNPHLWSSVEHYLLLKSEPQYYNDPVCRYGYYRGAAAAGYVKKVLNTFQMYCGE